jgi:hypothetical protein
VNLTTFFKKVSVEKENSSSNTKPEPVTKEVKEKKPAVKRERKTSKAKKSGEEKVETK